MTTNRIWFYLLPIAAVAVLAFGCRKSDPTTYIKISGRVLELESNKPIPNAKIGIYEEGGDLLGRSWVKLIDSFRTDSAGNYSYERHNIERGEAYFMTVSAPKYLKYDPNGYLPMHETVKNYDIILHPVAWIKVHVKNVRPYDSRDSIILGDVIGTLRQIHEGTDVDLTYINQVFGNMDMRAGWAVIKGNKRELFSDTIRIPAHDTISYEILY